MRKRNSKLVQLEKIGKELLWKHGIRRVTVEEICAEANVSKMTFYKYFKNKMDFVTHILKQVTDGAMHDYREIMQMDIPFKQKVLKTLDLKMKGTTDISEEFYHDYLKNANSEMVKFLHEQTQKSFSLVMQDYIEAQKRGDIRKDIKPEFILYFLNHMFDMLKDPQLEKMYDKPQDLIMEMVNFFFYGILPREQ